MTPMSPENNIIEIKELHKSYGARCVINNASLCIEQGQALAVVGENGAGKTTLLEILMGLRHADSGQVSILGQDALADNPKLREKIGFLSETVPFFDYLTVRQFLAFHRCFYSHWNDATASALLDTLKLDPKLKIANLSRGQKLRLGIVATLSHHPPLLILDEVTAGMDPLVRHQIISLIKEECKQHHTTVVFATNLLYQLQSFATHIVYLRDGVLSRPEPLDPTIDDMEAFFVSKFSGEFADNHG